MKSLIVFFQVLTFVLMVSLGVIPFGLMLIKDTVAFELGKNTEKGLSEVPKVNKKDYTEAIKVLEQKEKYVDLLVKESLIGKPDPFR